jgi:hypothetical protein
MARHTEVKQALFDDDDIRSGIDVGRIPKDGTCACFFGLLACLALGQVRGQHQVLELVEEATLMLNGLREDRADGGVETRATVADHQVATCYKRHYLV